MVDDTPDRYAVLLEVDGVPVKFSQATKEIKVSMHALRTCFGLIA